MKIVIDISPAVYRRAGIGRYAQELTRALSADIQIQNYEVFYNQPPAATPLLDPNLATVPRHVVPWSNKGWRLRVLLAQYFGYPQDGLFGEADLFHATDHLLPNLRHTAGVFSLHDLTFLTTETHTTLNKLFLRLAMRRFLARADAIIVPSESTKRDALRYYGLRAAKMSVIPYGVNKRFFQVKPGISRHVRRRYRLPETFILTVGTIEPRKNLSRLLDALVLLHEREWDIPLVVAGKAGWKAGSIERKMELLVQQHLVHRIGYVDDRDLPGLYQAATLFAYPSLYEGFGLPVLEAMASGVPVVSSNTSSLPEVAGDAAILIDPMETDEIADAIQRILTDDDVRLSMRERGQQRAKAFSWTHTAEETLAVYHRTAKIRGYQ